MVIKWFNEYRIGFACSAIMLHRQRQSANGKIGWRKQSGWLSHILTCVSQIQFVPKAIAHGYHYMYDFAHWTFWTKNINPQYFNEMFTLKKRTYDLRNNSILERPTEQLANYRLKSFKIHGAQIWNLLLASYKMGVSAVTFKNMIKSCSVITGTS